MHFPTPFFETRNTRGKFRDEFSGSRENLTSGGRVNHPSGYPQSSAASPVARNPEYLAFYKQNLELAVTNTYQGKLTPEQLSAMKQPRASMTWLRW
ncbi:hypothetical protein SBX64_07880 [Vibrio rhizosphaerae]|uniref:Uncharacterized protein n=1 Tax=Vibrio rhizosphaerae TaxID=398736 RepID=A0ABU4ISR9_9VIBR|nr:hypothetical protein [Vibrio rhizosphaerae]MDW6092462.1 hypothetical protein [Vibrio rhizosphaerae]